MIAIFNEVRPWSARNHTHLTESHRKRPGVPALLVSPRRVLPNHSGPCYFDGSPGLELVVQAGGNPDDATSAPSRVPGTAVVDDDGVRAIVTIRRKPSAAGAEIIMGVTLIDRVGRIEIPIEVLVEAVLPRDRVHICRVIATQRIVVVLPARPKSNVYCTPALNADSSAISVK